LPKGDYAAATALSLPGLPGAAPEIAAANNTGLFLSSDDGNGFSELDRGIAALGLGAIAGLGNTVAIVNGANGWLYSETLGAASTRRPNLGQNVGVIALSPDYPNDRVLFLEGAT